MPLTTDELFELLRYIDVSLELDRTNSPTVRAMVEQERQEARDALWALAVDPTNEEPNTEDPSGHP